MCVCRPEQAASAHTQRQRVLSRRLAPISRLAGLIAHTHSVSWACAAMLSGCRCHALLCGVLLSTYL